MKKQRKIKGLPEREYWKAYCEANKDKIAKQKKAYYEANKDKITKMGKIYREAKLKHQKEHPEEYLNVFGTRVYTNGITKEVKKELPNIINNKIREMLNE